MKKIMIPDPEFRLWYSGNSGGYKVSKPNIGEVDVYTHTQMEAYAAAKVTEALEAAILNLSGLCTDSLKARVPEAEDEHGWNQGCLERSLALIDAMLQIRAMIPK